MQHIYSSKRGTGENVCVRRLVWVGQVFPWLRNRISMPERTQRRWLRTSLLALGKMGLAPRGDIFLGKCQQTLESLAKDKQLCVCVFRHFYACCQRLIWFDDIRRSTRRELILCDTVWYSAFESMAVQKAGCPELKCRTQYLPVHGLSEYALYFIRMYCIQGNLRAQKFPSVDF